MEVTDRELLVAVLAETRALLAALGRLTPAAEVVDDPLLVAIDDAIGAIAFQAVDLIARAKRDSALSAVLRRHRCDTAIRLGRRLSALEKQPRRGRRVVQRLGRDGRGQIWAIVDVVDAVDSVSTARSTSPRF